MRSQGQWSRAHAVEKEVCNRLGGMVIGHEGGVDITGSPLYGEVEVKNDEKSMQTGNFAFEVVDNHGNPSGLTTSKSKHWVQVTATNYYVFETEILRQKLLVENNVRLRTASSDEGATNFIVPIETASRWAKEILIR